MTVCSLCAQSLSFVLPSIPSTTGQVCPGLPSAPHTECLGQAHRWAEGDLGRHWVSGHPNRHAEEAKAWPVPFYFFKGAT